jgi:hypothetical protein
MVSGWEILEEQSYERAVAQIANHEFFDSALAPILYALNRDPTGFPVVPGIDVCDLSGQKLFHRIGFGLKSITPNGEFICCGLRYRRQKIWDYGMRKTKYHSDQSRAFYRSRPRIRLRRRPCALC